MSTDQEVESSSKCIKICMACVQGDVGSRKFTETQRENIIYKGLRVSGYLLTFFLGLQNWIHNLFPLSSDLIHHRLNITAILLIGALSCVILANKKMGKKHSALCKGEQAFLEAPVDSWIWYPRGSDGKSDHTGCDPCNRSFKSLAFPSWGAKNYI